MLLDILNVKAWAIEPNFFNRAYPIVVELLRRGEGFEKLKVLDPNNEQRAAAYEAAGARWDRNIGAYVISSSDKKNIAFIPILGTLTKRGDMCSYGMHDYMGKIQRAAASEDIAGIVLEVESPGGSVDGTNELGLAIKNSKKPIIVFGDNIVASAAYWVSSQADEIFANANNLTDFGSIGTLFVYENYAKFIEKNIGEIRIIRAPQSIDKALINPIEPLPEESEAMIRAELKDITKSFIKTVKSGRGIRLNTGDENIFSGKMYSREDALAMGMIDAIGTLQDAVDRAAQLAGGTLKVKSSANNNQTKMINLKFLSSLFGKAEGEAKTEELTAEEQASLEAAETKLTELQNDRDQLRALVDSSKTAAGVEDDDKLVSAIEAKSTTITGHESTIADQKKKLEETPQGPATTAVTDEDPKPADVDPFKTSVDVELEKYEQNGVEKEEAK